jgi:membrane-bound serine protease (ClpP class)
MVLRCISLIVLATVGLLLPRSWAGEPSAPGVSSVVTPNAPVDVYVIPISGVIDTPNLYILRRGLKEAIANDVEMVILDMDTPGGRVDVCLEMMEMLNRFEGITATFVNDDAISAGSFIAAATQEIYFSPRGKMGAAAVIQGTGADVAETAKQKIESYLRANIRSMTEGYPYRSDVIRAMLDADFELKIGEEVLKPVGELLTLTAKEAMREYGDPPQQLLGAGIYSSMEALLDARFGVGNYQIKDFNVTYSEELAKWMNAFAPALMGLGVLLLFVEFKTPGFGIFGIGGLTLLGIFFASQYVAGLAGNEPVLFFVLGVLLVLVELFFFPGSVIFAIAGLCLMFGSLLWAMVDFWPSETGPINLSPEMFAEPLFNLIFGVGIAVAGALLVSRLLPSSVFERLLVLGAAAGGDSGALREERDAHLPAAGREGIAVTPLYPSGHIEVDGQRYDARCAIGMVERGAKVRVLQSGDFGLLVEEVRT